MTGDTRRLALRLKGPLGGGPELEVAVDRRAERLRQATESVLELPTLPESVARLMGMVDNPDTSARSLAVAISSDQVLTARVLKLANSSYYGFPQRVSTVRLALVMLGFDAVRDLALASTVMSAFRGSQEDAHFDIRRFWAHAVAVAVASRHLSRVLRIGSPGEAFTAGILHDIGQVVLHEFHLEAFRKVVYEVQENRMQVLDAELEVLGATHPQVGGWLCRRWNLPGSICAAVESHHDPFRCLDPSGLPAVVCLADQIAGATEEGGLWLGRGPDTIDPQLLQLLSSLGASVGVADLPVLLQACQQEIAKSVSLLDAFR